LIEYQQCVVDLLGSEVSSREDSCDDDRSRIADACDYFGVVSFQYSLIYISADDVLKRGGLLWREWGVGCARQNHCGEEGLDVSTFFRLDAEPF